MADKKISELPLATTPLAGTEEQEIIQGGVNKRVAVSEVGGGDGGAVDSVNGQTGVVVLDAGDVGADPAGTAAAILTSSITNGDTTHAPNGDVVFDALAGKQDTLVSGTNIKTVGGSSLLGSGNISVGVGDALVANPLSQFAATTSAQLAGVISDETGSGALVFGTSPTLVTPALGTPSVVVLTNGTGLPGTAVINTPAGNIAATNVQAAINELDTEKAPIASPTFTGVPAAPTAAPGTNTTQVATTAFVAAAVAARSESMEVPFTDEISPITATAGKYTFYWPYSTTTITGIWAGLTTPQTSGSIFTIDVNKNGTTILSTKITIDNTEDTSITAAVQPVISVASITRGDKVTIDVDQQGDNTAKGAKVVFDFTRA